ncbi:MAG: hypothetical protein AAF614_00955 [Chloroflexota bacterium]
MTNHSITHRFGQINIQEKFSPPHLMVQAIGYVGPKMLQDTLAYAQTFGKKHPHGWDYVVDTTKLGIAHPLNPIWLRKIHHLPHINRYIVINPSSPLMRLAAPLVKLLLGPDIMLDSVDRLDELLSQPKSD